ncbi:hypothetical protein [Bacillus sp. ISL-46]|uniref:hypothetical protein n=1 Tax=Bacillus sp. ISL-46 TaxID=2819129 RepID=UPI001BE8C4ED|nr:hypothetical protein [Bacillus sp. ISL-46]MBT2722336.1 hypothetical protein [Bacillus sp. ISL-46]
MLNNRDKAIIKDLNRFRVMDRDSIAELHFSSVKKPERAANNVLLRLLRDGEIQRSRSFVPYVYFGPEINMKQNSAKIAHFLAILNTYKEMRKLGKLTTFLVEPKYGSKGIVEPDIFAQFRDTNFFIEVQRTIYSEKQMTEKINRYLEFFHSGVMAKPFPHLLILSEQRYAIDMELPFELFQAQSFTQFADSLKEKKAPTQIQINSTKTNLRLKTN